MYKVELREAPSPLVLGSLALLACPVGGVSSEIAYCSNRVGEWKRFIHIMNPDGSKPIKLTEGGTPAWSPDGTKIAFWSDRVGQPDSYLMDANGEELDQSHENSYRYS